MIRRRDLAGQQLTGQQLTGRRLHSFFRLALIVISFTLPTRAGAQIDRQLDPTFDGDGRAVAGVGPGSARALVVQADGKIVVAGITRNLLLPAGFAFGVARFNPDGSLDTGFGVGGFAKAGFARDARTKAVFLEPDGKILVAGETSILGPNGLEVHLALARFDKQGALDAGFGAGGRMTSHLATDPTRGSPEAPAVIAAVARQPDGSFLVAGHEIVRIQNTLSTSFLVARFLPHDTAGAPLDQTFGQGGIVTTNMGENDGADAVLVQPADGKIVLAGTARIAGEFTFVAARYDASGHLDPTFGGDGIVTPAANGLDLLRDAALRSDGAVLLVGDAISGIALARFLPDGSPDPGFGGDGVVFTKTPGATNISARAVVLQRDGKAIVAGIAAPAGEPFGDFLVVRYNPDGSLDSTFGDDGVVFTDFDQVAGSTRGDSAYALALQPDGRILVAGSAELPAANGSDDALFALARYERVRRR